MKVYFSHGKESGPWGFKIKRLAAKASARGCEVESIDYRDSMDPDLRVERLLARLREEPERFLLVGSSMGGLRLAGGIHNGRRGRRIPDGAGTLHSRLRGTAVPLEIPAYRNRAWLVRWRHSRATFDRLRPRSRLQATPDPRRPSPEQLHRNGRVNFPGFSRLGFTLLTILTQSLWPGTGIGGQVNPGCDAGQ